MVFGFQRNASEVEDCRIEIRADDGRVADIARFGDAWRTDQERFADASFV